MSLVLSLFPGIGLLDMAFEEEGFCVVRGPDLLWGGDVRRFHPPSGKFDGVIGGPPCQAFSRLVHIVRANGHRIADDLIPEFERVIAEARPWWFVMENVEEAPAPSVTGYLTTDQIVRDVWVGGGTDRKRRFTWGTAAFPEDEAPERRLDVEWAALHTPSPERSIVCDAREVPVRMLKGARPKGGGTMPHTGRALTVAEMASRQGLPAIFLEDSPLTTSGKRQAIGNGVPLPMGRAIAKAVKRATSLAVKGA